MVLWKLDYTHVEEWNWILMSHQEGKIDSKWIANFIVSPQVLVFLEKREYVSEYQLRYGFSELSFVAQEIKLDNKYSYFVQWN